MTHLAVMLADGGDCLADIAVLRQQPDLFGGVASDPTVWRVLESIHCDGLRHIPGARAAVGPAWAAGAARRDRRRHRRHSLIHSAGRHPDLQAWVRLLPDPRLSRRHR